MEGGSAREGGGRRKEEVAEGRGRRKVGRGGRFD